MKIKVLIVDDEQMICEGLSLLLSNYEDTNVIGTCRDGLDAVRFCRSQKPDVVLMDIRMPKCDGVDGTRLIKEVDRDIKIVILTTFMDDEYIHNAIKNGASGYLLKDSSSDSIHEAIKNAFIGNVVMTPKIAQIMAEASTNTPALDKVIEHYQLTEKDLQFIQLVCNGFTNREIAEELYLSEGTVKNNIGKILTKLDLRDRTQMVIFAFKNRLV
ncbi:MAG TPA: response regulator transcription factor [Thermotogota bacterium]|nr:response regulator transcription factor [Thermotogota bacterium]HPF16464.1 response regulator transcription factor [Thermotogota bacterium]HRW34452.1 response regulator transcription factor [Thermotogota bacterium]